MFRDKAAEIYGLSVHVVNRRAHKALCAYAEN